MQTHRSLHTLKFVLYILAGLVLALGLIAGISSCRKSAKGAKGAKSAKGFLARLV